MESEQDQRLGLLPLMKRHPFLTEQSRAEISQFPQLMPQTRLLPQMGRIRLPSSHQKMIFSFLSSVQWFFSSLRPERSLGHLSQMTHLRMRQEGDCLKERQSIRGLLVSLDLIRTIASLVDRFRLYGCCCCCATVAQHSQLLRLSIGGQAWAGWRKLKRKISSPKATLLLWILGMSAYLSGRLKVGFKA